jgi:type IV secretory pathway VirB10-like protein
VFDVHGFAGRVMDGSAPYRDALVVDGQVVGHWQRVERKGVTIELQLARGAPRLARRFLDEAVARHAAFLGKPVTLSLR